MSSFRLLRAPGRRGALSFASAAAIVLFALVARAEPSSEERALADVRFHEGRELLDKQRYDDACPKFEESERLWPRGGTTLNLATCREKQGKTATAWAAYTRALALAQKEGRADREEIAKKKVAELQAELSWLVIQVPQELDVAGAVVTRDGTPVGRGAWGVPVPVDPGHHVVVANAPGLPPIEAAVDVGPRGDKKTILIPHPGGAAPAGPTQFPVGMPGFGFGQPRPPAELGAPGVVRLHVDTQDPRVRLFIAPSLGGMVNGMPMPLVGHPVCPTPCDVVVDGRGGEVLYFDGEGISRSPTFFISDKKGEMVAHVSPGASGLRALGFTLTVIGGIGIIVGGTTLLTGALTSSNHVPGVQTDNGLVPFGGVMLGVGAAVLVGGIVSILASRTRLELDDGHGAKFNVGAGPRLTPDGVAIAF